MDPLDPDNWWFFISLCFGLTAVVVGLVEWESRARHRTTYRSIEVRIKAIEERS